MATTMSNFDMKADFRASTTDGADRSHIPEHPMWAVFLRGAQLFLAFLTLVLAAVSASKFRSSDLAGLALTYFVFAWTVLYIGWLGASFFFVPQFYYWLAHLIIESLTVIFWLTTWAVLASEAAPLGDYLREADSVLGQYSGLLDGVSTSSLGASLRDVRVAIQCLQAATAMAALTWVLFVVSLVFLGMAVQKFWVANGGAAGLGLTTTNGAGPGGSGGAEQKPVEMGTVSVQQMPYADPAQQQQPVGGGQVQPQQQQQYQYQGHPQPQQQPTPYPPDSATTPYPPDQNATYPQQYPGQPPQMPGQQPAYMPQQQAPVNGGQVQYQPYYGT